LQAPPPLTCYLAPSKPNITHSTAMHRSPYTGLTVTCFLLPHFDSRSVHRIRMARRSVTGSWTSWIRRQPNMPCKCSTGAWSVLAALVLCCVGGHVLCAHGQCWLRFCRVVLVGMCCVAWSVLAALVPCCVGAHVLWAHGQCWLRLCRVVLVRMCCVGVSCGSRNIVACAVCAALCWCTCVVGVCPVGTPRHSNGNCDGAEPRPRSAWLLPRMHYLDLGRPTYWST
jgi:hypothetical protein